MDNEAEKKIEVRELEFDLTGIQEK